MNKHEQPTVQQVEARSSNARIPKRQQGIPMQNTRIDGELVNAQEFEALMAYAKHTRAPALNCQHVRLLRNNTLKIPIVIQKHTENTKQSYLRWITWDEYTSLPRNTNT